MPSHQDRVRRHYDPQVDLVRSRLLGEDTGNVKDGLRVHVERDPYESCYVLTVRISQRALQVARDTPSLLVAAWNQFEKAIKGLYAGLYEGVPSMPQKMTPPDRIDPSIMKKYYSQAANKAQGDWIRQMQDMQNDPKWMKGLP